GLWRGLGRLWRGRGHFMKMRPSPRHRADAGACYKIGGRQENRTVRIMKVVGFERDKALHLGVVEGDSVVDLQAVDARVPRDLGLWLADNDGDLKPLGDIARRAPAAARLPLANIVFALPVARPGKIVCLGLNYLEHAKEGGHQKPEFPSIFMR